MKQWESAVKKFISEWEAKEEVIGALLTGSYAVGNNHKYSDIDIHIVLNNDVTWRERGNVFIDGYLIEYFANPIKQLKKYLNNDKKNNRKVDARMFSTGIILFDKEGAVKEFKEEASREMEKDFEKADETSVEFIKYFIWDEFEELKGLYENKQLNFDLVYFSILSRIINDYSKFLGVEIPPITKLNQFLENDDFRKRYNIKKFPDEMFTEFLFESLKANDIDSKFNTLKKLIEYILNIMGGFNVDGWKVRTPLEL